jgi:hypothetical protein
MRHVYFSFHYEDVWKANQIRNSHVISGPRSAGFADRSLWEDAKAKSKRALRALIDEGLEGTSVTVVLIGTETARRPWVKYEIEKSLERGNALLGVHIHKLAGRDGRTARRGAVPYLLKRHRVAVHDWSSAKEFAEWVESAWRARNEEPELGFFESLARTLGF